MVRARPQEGHHPEVVTQGSSMRSLTTDTLDPPPMVGLRSIMPRASHTTHAGPGLLHRTPTVANDETPDSRYWTTYDRYIIERQARAIRREFVYGLITNAWRRLRERLTASSPVRAAGPHR